MEKIDIKKIYLGRATAENEKDELHKYFISTRAYLNSKDERRRKLFYIGHRGSGKSALFNQLTHEYTAKNSNIVIQVNPTEYSYETFRRLKHNFIDVKSAYSIAWHYTLLIHLFIEISNYFNEHKHLKKSRNEINILNKYLLENNFKDADTKLEVFLTFLAKINISRLKLSYKGLSLENRIEDNNAKELINLLDMKDIRKPLKALENIVRFHPIYMFIDELDTGWDNTGEAKNFISGLIYAATKINNIKDVSVFLSLRQDMYNNLTDIFKDTEKIRDEMEFLKWEQDLLKALICNRIVQNREVHVKFKDAGYMSHEDILSLVFEENVFEYILGCTLQRPREVIHFCNKALERYDDTYLSRGLFNKKIDKKVILEIKEKFSYDRLNDFCAEYNYELPMIKTLLVSFEGCAGLFTFPEFIESLETALLHFIEDNGELDWIKLYINNPKKLLKKLFYIGFLKLSVSSKNSFFAFYENNPLNFNNVEYVQINEVFKPALKCV